MKAPKVSIDHRPEGVVIRAEIWRAEGTAAAKVVTVPMLSEAQAVAAFSSFAADLLAEPIRSAVLRVLARELEITKEIPLSAARTRRETPPTPVAKIRKDSRRE